VFYGSIPGYQIFIKRGRIDNMIYKDGLNLKDTMTVTADSEVRFKHFDYDEVTLDQQAEMYH
jgi:hypothetical protein